jgi:UDP-3-O-[3-hydroxymyristoyl] glucosamine N-acyltransferase
MPDPRFFTAAGPFTLRHLAGLAGADLGPGADPDLALTDVAPLDAAGPGDLSFLDNRKYVTQFAATRASACIVHPGLAGRAPAGLALLLSRVPYKAYALAAQAFHPSPSAGGVVHPTAVIAADAVLGEGTEIGPFAVIGAGARLGPRCRVGAAAVIGARVEIGADTVIGEHVSISHSLIGSRVTIYPGARLGQDGFGFAMDAAGHVRVPQLGRVIVGDDVEIGANTTVDRGSGPDTVIGRGTMIDNLVQIAHNVEIGAFCVLVAQCGIAGSSRVGDFVAIGAKVGIAGHLQIGRGARIAALSGVMRDVPAGQEVCGSPAVPIKQFFREVATLARLSRDRAGHGESDRRKPDGRADGAEGREQAEGPT